MSIRDKYRPTQLKTLKEQSENEDQEVGNSGRVPNHKVESGQNKFRVYPKKADDESFTIMKVVHWHSILDETTGKPKRTNVFNSRNHGNTKLDINEEYITFVKNYLEKNCDDAQKVQGVLTAMNHWQNGIAPQYSWVCYADKIKNASSIFGMWEFRKSVRDKMNDCAIVEDEDEQITTDPFTDPDSGCPVILTYDESKPPKDKHKVQLSRTPKPLTDEQLEAFDQVKSLSSIFLKYTMKDFERALLGLAYFDAENDIGLFDTDEFKEIIDRVRVQYPEEAKEAKGNNSKTQSAATSAPKKSAPVKKAEPQDEYDEMSMDELEEFISENDLDIRIGRNDTEDKVRKLVRAAMLDRLSDDGDTNSDEDQGDDKAPTSEVSAEDVKSRLKERFAKKA